METIDKHFILLNEPKEQTENFENIVQTLCALKKKLPATCKYTQQHVGIKKEYLQLVLKLLEQFSGPLKVERKWIDCFDVDAACPLLMSGFWLTRSYLAENSQELEDEDQEEQVDVETSEKWELRQVKRVVIGNETIALEVDRTTVDKKIHEKLMSVTGEQQQDDFCSYGLEPVCSHIYRRIWLFANDDIEMYIDDMKYDDGGREKYYVVASIKVFGPLSQSEEIVKTLGTIPFVIQPARSKIVHQVLTVKPQICKAIISKEHSNQRRIDFHTAECVYDGDPIDDKEKQQLLEDVKAWMQKNGYLGNVQDYVSRYNAIYRLVI